MGLEGHRFVSAEKIQHDVTSGLRAIQEDDFQMNFPDVCADGLFLYISVSQKNMSEFRERFDPTA
jgi:hypothetical protein